jgi:hypothetical protein
MTRERVCGLAVFNHEKKTLKKHLFLGDATMIRLNTIGWVALVLTIIGAIVWGLVGIFGGYNLVSEIFGEDSALARIVYILVGLSGLYLLGEIAATYRTRTHERHEPHPAT